MAQFSRTWWGRRFIEALEGFTDPARLGRGRSYASGGKITEYRLADGMVTARVRGSINPYFGVYKEPLYTTTIAITQISPANWSRVIDRIAANARQVTALLLNEMPDTIDETFTQAGVPLLPHSQRDFTTTCSCPDYANPCKHIAGVYYLLASALDDDPFLLFEMRGLSRQRLREELARAPLGQILSADLAAQEQEAAIEAVLSYFTSPVTEPADALAQAGHKAFWTGYRRLPPLRDTATRASVPALLIKKQGDFPPFWHKDASFIAVMEQFYERVRAKSPQLK